MKINVEMTAEEFQEFMQWKKDEQVYKEEITAADSKIEHINNKILWALGPNEKQPGKVKIIDQEHAAELVDMANDRFS